MESLTDPSLIKLIRYERIRDLYQFISEIILNRINQKKGKKDKKQRQPKQISKNPPIQNNKLVKQVQKIQTFLKQNNASLQWSEKEQKYLCAVYLERSLMKCCIKLKQKYGQSPKWDTTKKVYMKAQQLFQKSLKKAVKSQKLKQLLEELNTNRENLVHLIIQKKSNQLQRKVLKYEWTDDRFKKAKCLNAALRQIFKIWKKNESTVKVLDQDQKVKQQIIEKQISKQNSQSLNKIEIKIEVNPEQSKTQN